MGKPIASVAGGRQSVLLGLGVHRPERVVTNDEICELIDSTDEWIQTRSGIKSRRFSGEGEGILAMSISAVLGLLWVVVFYVITNTSTHIPFYSDLGQWNIVIGMGFIIAAFGFATKWE